MMSVLAYGAHVSHSPFYIFVSETPWTSYSNDVGETVNSLKPAHAPKRMTINKQFKKVFETFEFCSTSVV